MKCKDIEISVVSGNPFAEDKLNRQPLAQNLTDIANMYADTGAVIALDGEWGSGKTTFVRMWHQMLLDRTYKSIYFNAWNTDFQDDPFIAIMSELDEVFQKSKTFSKVVKSGAKIGLKVAGEVAKGILHKATGVDAALIKTGVDELVDQCYQQMSEYQSKKDSLESFRNQLSEFVASEANGKPVFFFIDELDRCNPHYAVKLLERVKHLFEVPNIIFVLAVNISQLQYAVQGFYGSSNIDGKEYLRRFIDIEYTLPAPNMEEYCKFLFDAYDFGTFFNHESLMRNRDLQSEGQVFNYISSDITVASNISLRAANKIFAYTRLALSGYNPAQHFSADLFFLLCYFKVINRPFYNQIKIGEFSIQGLLDAIEKNLPEPIFHSDDNFIMHHISYAVATLLIQYNYQQRGIPREPDFKGKQVDSESDMVFPIKSKKFDLAKLNEALTYESQKRYNFYGLQSALNKIDLVDSLKLTGVN